MLDVVLFAAFPYVAVVLAVVVGIYRYFNDRFSYSSFSSQFLENRSLFWGSVPWHYGVILILLAHLVGLLVPGLWARLIAAPVRLYTLEIIGLALALAALAGLVLLIIRRLRNPRIFTVTSTMDWVLLAVLLAQVALGFWVALFFRWGSDWYLHTAVPWIISLAKLNPQTQFVTALPWVVKLHMLGGFLLIALFPFTRLVHIVAFPVAYLWRPYQVVIWNNGTARQRRQG
ncbi:MAG: respiratory nitrate reductase subunit gamma [Chloroflexota bacterium]